MAFRKIKEDIFFVKEQEKDKITLKAVGNYWALMEVRVKEWKIIEEEQVDLRFLERNKKSMVMWM